MGVVHRDLKPSNLMLSRPGSGALHVKLMDMGLAASEEEIDLTEERGLTGTVHYMSPEQIRGTGIDQRLDLYALGVMLYEILTGRLPFDGESPATVALKHIREVPVPLRQHRSDIPTVLQQAVQTLLEKEPVSRYSSAGELRASLAALGGSDPGAESRSFKGTSLPLRPRFVGRAEELSVLRRLLSDASEGRGRMVVLSGEAGIGKTALLARAFTGPSPSSGRGPSRVDARLENRAVPLS
jgi:serine/threonine protein kinase